MKLCQNLLVCAISLLSTSVGGIFGVDWDYKTQSSWATDFPLCGGQSQSPIVVGTHNSYAAPFSPFVFNNYNAFAVSQTVLNDGHTVKVTPAFSSAADTASIQGGGLTEPYILAQYHLHWGRGYAFGSEHRFGGQSFFCYWYYLSRCFTPVELHLVHYKTSAGSLGNALAQSDGLAVLGTLFKLSYFHDNTDIQPLLDSLSDIRNSGQYVTVANLVPFSQFLPSYRDRFFRYAGSLTTPPCSEAVVWTVFEQRIKISFRQLRQLQTALLDKNYDPIVDNYRSLQQPNGRFVYRSFNY